MPFDKCNVVMLTGDNDRFGRVGEVIGVVNNSCLVH